MSAIETGRSDGPVKDWAAAYQGRRVLVTGHTGFKGGWLVAWLQALGAEVSGLALAPDGSPNLFEQAGLGAGIDHNVGDIGNADFVAKVFRTSRPEIVFHLAAQAIVGEAYADPIGTATTNVIGTLIALEAARRSADTRAIVIVTSDKSYRNQEWPWSYRETDTLGGHDPYSASKAAAELVTEPYFDNLSARRPGAAAGVPLGIATVRAGNVIGGGDWSRYRIVPDIVRAMLAGEPLLLRAPGSVRPWQHVLEPLGGYLEVAARLWHGDGVAVGSWNFGPLAENAVTVAELVEAFRKAWPEHPLAIAQVPGTWREAGFLRLSTDKARALLGWRPHLDLPATVGWTVDGYRADTRRADLRRVMDDQIAAYMSLSSA